MKIFKIPFTVLAFFLLTSCSSNEDENVPAVNDSLLIGEWQRIGTEDQDGIITDDTYSCNITEFTENNYIVTDYLDTDCTQEFSSGSLPYTKVEDLIYFGEVSQDIKVEITNLSSTTLELKGEYSDNTGNIYYDIVTYSRR